MANPTLATFLINALNHNGAIHTPHMLTQTSSMFQQGISQSSVWQGNVWIGCSPDGTCGATPAPEGAMKCDQTKFQ